MKTKTHLCLLATALLTVFISCKQSTNSGDTKPDETTNIPSDRKAKYTIPVADIKTMVSKYRSERQEIINRNPDLQKQYGDNFMDSRCSWFSIDELKKFIAEVERNNPRTKLSGLRMYYTVYPAKQENESSYLKSIPEQDRNHVSLVLIPTYYDEKNHMEVDFIAEPLAKEQQEGGDSTGGRSAAGFAPSQQSSPALNHGALCPPSCPTGFVSNSYLNN